MSRKRYRSEEISVKLREANVLLNQEAKAADVVKAIEIHEMTYYRSRKERGGLQTSQAKWLRKAVSDLMLDKMISQEAVRGNFWAPNAAAPASSPSVRSSRCQSGARGVLVSIGPWAAQNPGEGDEEPLTAAVVVPASP